MPTPEMLLMTIHPKNEPKNKCAEQLCNEGTALIQCAALLEAGTIGTSDVTDVLTACIEALTYWQKALTPTYPKKG
jgi:hypothetical protein